MDWAASLVRGLLMVVLPIAAFALGITSATWHDDALRKAVIAKTWSSTPAGTEDEKPVDAENTEDAKDAEDGVARGNQPNPDPKMDDGG